ncbi:uncharacterized protein LOC143289045 isoform X2 [Babylonia areolata]|uniref:uncharacterized protein LOC143289045 isoform X2 n=1 Tax=Babylonia areolata TaxID=304850 RepID=UPI003FD23BCF
MTCVFFRLMDGVIEKGKYKQWRRVVPVEEFYDVLLDTHVHVLKHGGYKILLKAVLQNYAGIPREAASKFVSLCCVCQSNPRHYQTAKASEARRHKVARVQCSTNAFNVRAEVDTINMDQNTDGVYTHVGLYMDHWTQFLTLFPMTGSSAQHVALGLLSSVFPYFGPPHFLHSPEGKEFATQVIELCMASWKGEEKTALPQGKPGLEELGQRMDEIRSTVIQKIDDRAVRENVETSLPWGSWLGKIMFDINNKVNKETGQSAYSRLFEKNIMSMASEPVKDVACKDRKHEAATSAQDMEVEFVGPETSLPIFIEHDGTAMQQYFIEEGGVILQTDPSSSTQIVLEEEADAVLPVATEVLVDSQVPDQPHTFTTTYLDPSGHLQNFIINVQATDT